MANKDSSIGEIPAQESQRSGRPDKAPIMDGPAGKGAVTQSKWGKDSRDSVSEKEPGKSRGPGG